MADPSETMDAATAAVTTGADEAPQQKKRRVDRREKLRKTALCKHFDKPGGCPFPNCRFAHGRDEVQEGDTQTLAAQRKFIREQVLARMEGRFEEQTKKSMARPGTMIERYYTQLFACDVMGKQREDHYVHMHSNRICVVGVAPTHPVMAEEIESIEFSNNVLDSRVSGKKKKGGQFLLPESILCHIRCKSGASYAIRSCMRGTLLEVNESLVANPRLLQEKPISDGYLVVVQPKTNEIIDIQESLLTKDEYNQYRTQPMPEQPST
ncbi:hypothetical protein Poli38472_000466 [Pythium oligandrum]|uniref:Protein Abitram n=1 Tax=Pythium oligandrum TaxID=41045 RepID=A0A8K1CCC7_PYTOL|nr:hypothetical protein Poli38472_000466 [Pythium oligandrum]|eukprot:TMW60424.1 hypothetical protein Poli38472_000466 [Pythium oligandrum]